MAKLQIPVSKGRLIDEPPIAKFLFSDRRMAIFWVVVRVLIAIDWINAGIHKVEDPAWLNGSAIKAFWARIVVIPAAPASPTIKFDWYRVFINGLLNSGSHTWFGPLVAWGELLIGIALLIGAFTGIAAFFGALLNWNFIMAGSASTNGLLLIAAVGIMLAWKIAGYIGADFFLLRLIGVPWKGEEVKPKESPTPAAGK
ncbi:MAG: DoxX family membrane protein [Anaerolineae bacterium]|nr:DoxX family membrane protein [Anaerolineae bacterium]